MLFPGLEKSVRIGDLQGNSFLVMSANGYPFGKKMIADVLSDVQNHGTIDHLFVCVDAEEDAVDARYQEVDNVIKQHVATGTLFVRYSIIVQNRTIETWFLGNRRIISRSPQGEALRTCLQHYSVLQDDPEDLPVPNDFFGNHAMYHAHYLNAVFSEHNMTYRKSSPGEVLKESYLRQLVLRTRTTGHLATLNHFFTVCQTLGGDPSMLVP
ncbi:putative RloB domain-containing protein [uncultured Gammaproteobacteria bacterium]